MTPRPLYRLKSFWIGLIFLGLAGWGSLYSKRFILTYEARISGETFVIYRMDAGTALLRSSSGSTGHQGLHIEPKSTDDRWKVYEQGFRATGVRVWRVRDAAVLLVLLFCWFGWLGMKILRNPSS